MSQFSSAEEIVAEARAGRMFILCDDEDRENEGDLIVPASFATSVLINFMVTHARGLVCLALTKARADQLDLTLQPVRGSSRFGTAFTISIEAAKGVTTGISAFDRAETIRAAIAPQASPSDLVTPGHIFPLIAREGGVLERRGHTEAAVDIAYLAGHEPAGVICEILNEDGSMARVPDLMLFAEKHGLKIGTVADLVAYRKDRASY